MVDAIVNSDDELIGAFDDDDDEFSPDENEDEIDQDIVVSTPQNAQKLHKSLIP